VIWVGWRQQRTETLIAAGILALLALLLVPTGIDMAGAYHHDGLSACLGPDSSSSCGVAIQSFTSRFEPLGNLVAWLTLVPGLIGVLLAAPFVLEFENGTYRFAWTQSITRRRWIAGKLGLAVGAAVLVGLAMTILLTWWRTPLVHLNGRMDPSAFDSEGLVMFGYILFALGLAAAVGAVWRRAVPALVVAFAGYFATRVFVDVWLRQRLASPLTATWPNRNPEPARLRHAWVITEEPSDRLGHAVAHPFGHCVRALGTQVKPDKADCLAQIGAGFTHAVYEPASRFWLLQGVETGIFGGVAIALTLFAAWWTHQRAT
jgi:hypothetical protein